ncbi:MAG: hypothetical protein AMJ65_19150 [Phycisphaerae bacterium SG8_4]|nr:MAG: hypothetical protein AMJ65_19150 [Phycisphaerae bacterium SG8_4]
MKPAEDIHELVKKLQVEPSANVDKRVHDHITKALDDWEESKHTSWRDRRPRIGRIVMRSRVTRIAAAAAIVVACLIGLIFWRGTASGIALADVLAKLEQVTTYSYQTHSILTRRSGGEERHSTVLISQDQGIKITLKKIDPNGTESEPSDTYILPEQNRIVFVMHEDKTYVRVNLDDDTELEQHKGENNDPRIIVEKMLKHQHNSLGQSVVNGVTVEGFQTTDPNYDGGFMTMSDMMGKNEEVDIKLWVDVKTFLPVRLEEDIVKDTGTRFHEVTDNFNWNAIVRPDDLKPVIPEGYTSPVPEIHIPVFDEETAIKGLRLYADAAGAYPVDLKNKTPIQDYRKIPGNERSAWESLPDDEQSRRVNDILMPILGLGAFYEELVEDKKDPAYYGDTIGLSDTDKVLLRWRLDNKQYRVIFGDLSAKTIASEELSELEKR